GCGVSETLQGRSCGSPGQDLRRSGQAFDLATGLILAQKSRGGWASCAGTAGMEGCRRAAKAGRKGRACRVKQAWPAGAGHAEGGGGYWLEPEVLSAFLICSSASHALAKMK